MSVDPFVVFMGVLAVLIVFGLTLFFWDEIR